MLTFPLDSSKNSEIEKKKKREKQKAKYCRVNMQVIYNSLFFDDYGFTVDTMHFNMVFVTLCTNSPLQIYVSYYI